MLKTKNLKPFNQFFHVQKSTISACPGLIDSFRVAFEVPDFIYEKMTKEPFRVFIAFKPKGEQDVKPRGPQSL